MQQRPHRSCLYDGDDEDDGGGDDGEDDVHTF